MPTILDDYLRHNVVHFGGRTAVTIDDDALTYTQLAVFVEDARLLLGKLIEPGDRVAIWLPNSFSWIASFLAVASLGGVLVPINTRLTGSEVVTILADAGVRVLITAPSYRGRDYLEEARDIAGSLVASIVSAPPSTPPSAWQTFESASQTRGEPLAGGVFCIQYTSGTTATPKGVMLTQPLYIHGASYVANCQRLTPASNFMSAAPFFHCSGSMHAVTTCLVSGATLHSMSVWDPDYFLRLVERHRGDTGHGIFFRDIVALGAAKACKPLTTLKVANDIEPPEFLRRLAEEFGITGIANIYGMTETGGNLTMWYPHDPFEKRITGNGRPQAPNAIRIVDPETGETRGFNEPGEIQMKGPTITPGYYRRPDANAAAFTADGWFRSGDAGMLSPEGELRYLARQRDVIRVGGENVAPAEVEQALCEETGLKLISVVGVPDERLGEVAAAVAPASENVDWLQVLDKLRARLAGFKMPRQVYVTDAMPMTATNKVQRAVLRQWIGQDKLRRVV
ncbi:class I adenylate-forming enzyme family protein [Bradyrhizobium sp. LHD-71]|uniref:class I adenylate-forming enzyme family protein n=1 Tax=Bradyrhizobium sp. LHD-71 TaxID=3072141 RepID=UPI00280F43CB|nr:class I adenylate-forming enzyme family protein [Bradyrhizobium sp. LHD-71]MDQ8729190.1 class I adenylate-forming enzyme family protein [Bradyrhizobium sp. LHD-71]